MPPRFQTSAISDLTEPGDASAPAPELGGLAQMLMSQDRNTIAAAMANAANAASLSDIRYFRSDRTGRRQRACAGAWRVGADADVAGPQHDRSRDGKRGQCRLAFRHPLFPI